MITLCGGASLEAGNNCLTMTNGTWTESNQLKYKRWHHTSWSRRMDIILLGGSLGKTSEVVHSGNSRTSVGFKLSYVSEYEYSIEFLFNVNHINTGMHVPLLQITTL